MTEHLLIHVDGGSRGNPGPAGAGVTISRKGEGALFEGGFHLEPMTNNMAEYQGLINALQVASAWPGAELTIHSDSELMVRQLTGRYRVKNPGLAELFAQVQQLLLQRDQWRIVHVPRERNSRADALANQAMDAGHDVTVIDLRRNHADSAATNGVASTEPSPHVDGALSADSVVVRCNVAPDPDACEAPCRVGTSYVFGPTCPADICLNGLGAMLNTILAIREAPREDGRSIPTLTVRCAKSGCGASFEIRTAPAVGDKKS